MSNKKYKKFFFIKIFIDFTLPKLLFYLNMNTNSPFQFKKQNETVIDEIVFHPDIQGLLFQYLTMPDILSLTCVNGGLYSYVPEHIKDITTNVKCFANLVASGRVFTKVRNLMICESKLDKPMKLTSSQFPSLKKAQFYYISAPVITIEIPTLEELFVKESSWNRIEELEVCPTLRKISVFMNASTAEKLFRNQPLLEVAEVDIRILSINDNPQKKFMFLFDQLSLRCLIFKGVFRAFVRIVSLEHMEELNLSRCHCSVTNHVLSSSMRCMSITQVHEIHPKESDDNNILGHTKFPKLNLFQVDKPYQNNILRVYNECITRDQNNVEPFLSPYFMTEKCNVVAEYVLYCNGLNNIRFLEVRAVKKSTTVFLANMTNLESLFAPDMKSEWNISIQTQKFRELKIDLTSENIDIFNYLLRNHSIRKLIISYQSQELWNSALLTSPSIQDVQSLSLECLYNSKIKCLTFQHFSKLQSLHVYDNFVSDDYFDLRFVNLPLLTEVFLYGEHIGMSLTQWKVFIDKCPCLNTITIERGRHTIICGKEQKMITINSK